MQITVIVNPRSGRGTAKAAAQTLQYELGKRDHMVHVIEAGADSHVDQAELQTQIAESDRVVIIGGDGTVHHLLPILTQVETPMYHLGTGTANLICKEFGMSQSAMKVVGHLESEFTPTVVDVPNCNGVPFLIMVSLGIDASVIHRFENSRKQRGGYRAYIKPIIQELFQPRPAVFSFKINNSPPFKVRGIMVVSNLRSYGGGFSPNPDANPKDGMLDIALMLCSSSLHAAFQYSLLKLGRSLGSAQMALGSVLEIDACEDCCVQVDGEKASFVPGLNDGRLEPGDTLQITMNGQYIRLHAPETVR